MVDEDRESFAELLQGVYALKRVDISAAVMRIWWNALKVYDLNAISDAFGRQTVNPDNGQFLPQPADVVKMIEGSTLDSALAAWAKVDRAIGQVGTYRTVVFDDPLIHRVIADMGGWPGLGMKSIEELPFVAKEFQTRYRGFRVRRDVPAYPQTLIGIIEQQNGQKGYLEDKPVLIGDAVAARAVLAGGTSQPLLSVSAA